MTSAQSVQRAAVQRLQQQEQQAAEHAARAQQNMEKMRQEQQQRMKQHSDFMDTGSMTLPHVASGTNGPLLAESDAAAASAPRHPRLLSRDDPGRYALI